MITFVEFIKFCGLTLKEAQCVHLGKNVCMHKFPPESQTLFLYTVIILIELEF